MNKKLYKSKWPSRACQYNINCPNEFFEYWRLNEADVWARKSDNAIYIEGLGVTIYDKCWLVETCFPKNAKSEFYALTPYWFNYYFEVGEENA